MTNISRNVLNDVIRCIERCTEHKLALSELGRVHGGNEAVLPVLQRAQDMILDMEIELCKLAASLVTAPISGRMFIPLPPEYISKQAQTTSMHAQLRPTR
jgi:hypothetical protein